MGLMVNGIITLQIKDDLKLNDLENYLFDGEKFVLKENLESTNIQEKESLDENKLSESENILDEKMLKKIESMRAHSTIFIVKTSDELFNQLIFPENIDKSQIKSLERFQRYTDYYFTYYLNQWYLIDKFELTNLIEIDLTQHSQSGESSYYMSIKGVKSSIPKEVYQLISDLRK